MASENSEQKFCTYAYKDPKSGLWRYVGEGSLSRPFDHFKRTKNHKFSNMLKKRVLEGFNPSPYVIRASSKEDAQEMEALLISMIGREDRNVGSLFNLTDGGDGGKGRIQTIEERNKRSLITTESYKNPKVKSAHLAGCRTNEARQNNRNAQLRSWDNSDRKDKASSNLKRLYANGRVTNSEGLKAYFKSPEAKAKNSEAQRKAQNRSEVSLKKKKRCTVDGGKTVFDSCRDMINTLGQGLNGYGSSTFCWIINETLISR